MAGDRLAFSRLNIRTLRDVCEIETARIPCAFGNCTLIMDIEHGDDAQSLNGSRATNRDFWNTSCTTSS